MFQRSLKNLGAKKLLTVLAAAPNNGMQPRECTYSEITGDHKGQKLSYGRLAPAQPGKSG
jgi:hypothetical protein